MDARYYETIFKRKSFHLFRNVGEDRITAEELDEIQATYASFEALYPDIRTAMRILPASALGFRRDAQYYLLLYSEQKENYLTNIGFIGQQLDLYLVKHDIGTLWYGMGKPDELTYDGLDYVIMLMIHKVNNPALYRKDMFKAKRKPLSDIWKGETMGVAEIARFAPSACNSQPWFVKNDGDTLTVYRRKAAKVGLMTPKTAAYNNRIDMGIFLCILEICMAKQQIPIQRSLFIDLANTDDAYTKVAEYCIQTTE